MPTEAFPDPVAQRVLNEAGGDINEATRRLVARNWELAEAAFELSLCIPSKELRRAPRQPRRTIAGGS